MSIWIDTQHKLYYEVNEELCNVHIYNIDTNEFVEECVCVVDECTGAIAFSTQDDIRNHIHRLIIPFLNAMTLYKNDGMELFTTELEMIW